MNKADRIAQISELFREHEQARDVTQNPVWAKLWDQFERELLERLLDCDATENEKRWRCQTSIEACRTVRRLFEAKSVMPAGLEKELAFLEGAKMRPVA